MTGPYPCFIFCVAT